MIATLEKPVSDEMATSWTEHIAKLNGMSLYELYRWHFGMNRRSNRSLRIDYLQNLEYLCRMEQRSNIFPNLEEILKNHTDLYASLPFMTEGIQAKYFEHCLRHPGHPGNISGMKPLFTEYRVCPQCAAEDRKQHGRLVMHVPHQMPTVHVCWKHGVRLQKLSDYNEGSVEQYGGEREQEIAAFWHELYQNPVMTSYELVKDNMTKLLEDRGMSLNEGYLAAAADGYLEKEDIQKLSAKNVAWKYQKMTALLRVLPWLYKTVQNFRNHVPEMVFPNAGNDEFEVIKGEGPLFEYRCRTCGSVFHMHPKAVQVGVPCPDCAQKMDEADIFERYMKRLGDGQYEFTNEKRTMLRHKVCGGVVNIDVSTRFWADMECQQCQKRDILDWQKIVDPDEKEYRVQSIIKEKGERTELEVEHIGHGHWFRISSEYIRRYGVSCTVCAKHAKERVGMTIINKQGKRMTIIAYRSNLDMDVELENGHVIQMTYANFLKGLGSRKDRIQFIMGEKGVNRHGWEMEIVAYRTITDIGVRFYDGTIVKTTYEKFQRGTVFYPGDEERPPRPINTKGRIGEVNYNTKGERMVIIAYRNARDIDVQFDDGTIKEHVIYDAFKKGHVRKPKK